MSDQKPNVDQSHFNDGKVQMQERIAEHRHEKGKIECLGMLFESEEERRTYFLKELCQKLQDSDFHRTPGFPRGDDDVILSMSDPPYYTVCPNPFLRDLVTHWQSEKNVDGDTGYHREPFAFDVSEGKSDTLYKAHSYHTKVPPLAIVPFILHYTNPSDIILDGFAGSGMTGVAAQLTGHSSPEMRRKIESNWMAAGGEPPIWGPRKCILNDLSPIASFITANYNLTIDIDNFTAIANQLLKEMENEIGWMYETAHSDGSKGKINYMVWSQVFICPDCSSEVPYLENALDKENNTISPDFPCPSCNSILTKKRMKKLYESITDPISRIPIQVPKRVPVIINYKAGGKVYEKKPDESDLSLIQRINGLPWPVEIPTMKIPYMHMTHERARMDQHGITHVHHFFLPRQAHALATMWRIAHNEPDVRLRSMLLWFVEQAIWGLSVQNRYRPVTYSHANNYMSGVFYVPSSLSETSPWYFLPNKVQNIARAFSDYQPDSRLVGISAGDQSNLMLNDASIDYIFTDPPFGENIYYSDLNFLLESWYGLLTDSIPEAIVDDAKKKGLPEYQELMRRCFLEYCRVLKAGHWMTVVFSNSRNSVWNAIQEAMLSAGFVVADVRTLDKQMGSYRQVTSSAVKQDLIISAYKPNRELEQHFKTAAGTEEGVWQFIRNHLNQVSVFAKQNGLVEIMAERQGHLLFDRMIAFHVRRGVTVPLSKGDFLVGLAQRFPERDGMFFLPEQVAEYDRKRREVKDLVQLQIIVTDESSAIHWLRQEIKRKPQTFQEIHPDFMKEIAGWQKYEKPIELMEILRENFIQFDGEGEVPAPIHAYLSSNYHELRGLSKDDPQLQEMAKDRWYIPDPKKASDLERIRERELLREFSAITSTNGRVKQLRTEAAKVGFKALWEQGDYKTIIEVAMKLPTNVVEEDPHLMMYVDLAKSRLG